MSKSPAFVVSSRVRCARCNRFVFRGTACRCRLPARDYRPTHDGVLGFPSAPRWDVEPYTTARPKWPELDHEGHTSSVDAIGGAA